MKSKRSLSGEKKYYLADLSFYLAQNTDNRIPYGPVLENMVYTYARSQDYSVSVGRIGKLECDFILRDNEMQYSYVQVAYTIALSKETEDREYRAQIRCNDRSVLTAEKWHQKCKSDRFYEEWTKILTFLARNRHNTPGLTKFFSGG